MKKLLVAFLVLCIILCGCGGEKPTTVQSTQEVKELHNIDTTRLKGGGVKVGIIDSGYKTKCKDLAYERIVPHGNWTSETYNDLIPHGLCVLSILNGKNGLVPNATCYVYKVFEDNSASSSNIARAITQAVADGCDVINLSCGSYGYSKVEAEAIKNAVTNGVIVVAAAGNDSSSQKMYPACLPNVMSVGACDNIGQIESYSNRYGVDCLALGTAYVLTDTKSHSWKSGTSFAAPVVTALAVKCKQVNPNIDAKDFMKIISKSGTRKSRSDSKGYGVVDFKKAIKQAKKIVKASSEEEVVYELII